MITYTVFKMMNFHLELTCAVQDGKGLARDYLIFIFISRVYHLLVGLPTVYVLFWVWVLSKDHSLSRQAKLGKKAWNITNSKIGPTQSNYYHRLNTLVYLIYVITILLQKSKYYFYTAIFCRTVCMRIRLVSSIA